jgi:integrase
MHVNLGRRRYQRGQLVLRGKKGNEVWVGRWREDLSVTGLEKPRRIHRSVVLGKLENFPTKRLARRLLDKELEKINSISSYAPKHHVSFEDFATRWEDLEVSTMRPSSQRTIRSALDKRIIPHFGSRLMMDITTEEVQGFLQGLAPERPRSFRNMLGILKMLWNCARRWEYVEKDILWGIRVPRQELAHQACFTLEQVRAILHEAREPYKTMFHIAAETGIRAGELMGVRRKDVDLDKMSIRIVQTVWEGRLQIAKTERASRTIAISESLAEHLREYLASNWTRNTLGLLFATRNGNPFDAGNVVQLHLHPIMEKLAISLSPCGFHAFRHTSASLMDGEGVPLRVRQGRLGHADPKTTIKIYTHILDNKADREIANRLGEMFAEEISPREGVPAANTCEDASELVEGYFGS